MNSRADIGYILHVRLIEKKLHWLISINYFFIVDLSPTFGVAFSENIDFSLIIVSLSKKNYHAASVCNSTKLVRSLTIVWHG